jgi:putative membrane protein
MKTMSTRMMACVAVLGLGVIVLAAGVAGAWVVLPLLGCVLMMGGMMWMMGGGMGHGRGGSSHHQPSASATVRQLLDERLARGEIDLDEYQHLRDAIEHHTPAAV